MNDFTPVINRAVVLRAATADDVDTIAAIWHRGWSDGHLGHVPEALVQHRHRRDFLALVPERLATTTVAESELGVVGFVTVDDDEVEEVYVDRAARGRGVADALLGHAEAIVAERFDRAWLAVVAGNARARRFYERVGWADAGPIAYAAPLPDGSRTPVPARRYERRLARSEGGRGSREA
jgi:ribosomal protein S18 acetylase RimI-like enzyme